MAIDDETDIGVLDRLEKRGFVSSVRRESGYREIRDVLKEYKDVLDGFYDSFDVPPITAEDKVVILKSEIKERGISIRGPYNVSLLEKKHFLEFAYLNIIGVLEPKDEGCGRVRMYW